jgi:hypothetical protein
LVTLSSVKKARMVKDSGRKIFDSVNRILLPSENSAGRTERFPGRSAAGLAPLERTLGSENMILATNRLEHSCITHGIHPT